MHGAVRSGDRSRGRDGRGGQRLGRSKPRGTCRRSSSSSTRRAGRGSAWPRSPTLGLPVATRSSTTGPTVWETPTFQVSELQHRHPSDKVICDEVRAAPGEVTIVALGPLTNIARAFARDPALPEMIDQIVIMGGTLDGVGQHHAGRRVQHLLRSGVGPGRVSVAGGTKTLVPLDVTRQGFVRLRPARQAARQQTRAGRFLRRFCRTCSARTGWSWATRTSGCTTQWPTGRGAASGPVRDRDDRRRRGTVSGELTTRHNGFRSPPRARMAHEHGLGHEGRRQCRAGLHPAGPHRRRLGQQGLISPSIIAQTRTRDSTYRARMKFPTSPASSRTIRCACAGRSAARARGNTARAIRPAAQAARRRCLAASACTRCGRFRAIAQDTPRHPRNRPACRRRTSIDSRIRATSRRITSGAWRVRSCRCAPARRELAVGRGVRPAWG